MLVFLIVVILRNSTCTSLSVSSCEFGAGLFPKPSRTRTDDWWDCTHSKSLVDRRHHVFYFEFNGRRIGPVERQPGRAMAKPCDVTGLRSDLNPVSLRPPSSGTQQNRIITARILHQRLLKPPLSLCDSPPGSSIQHTPEQPMARGATVNLKTPINIVADRPQPAVDEVGRLCVILLSMVEGLGPVPLRR